MSDVLKLLVSVGGNVETSLKNTTKTVNELEKDIDSINKKGIAPKVSPKAQKGVQDLSKSTNQLSGILNNATGKLSSMAGGLPVVGEGLMSITAALGPVGIAIGATIGALVGIGSHLVGVTNELEGVRKQFTLLSNDSKTLDTLTAKAQSLKKVFGTSEEEIAKAANTISKEFGISSVEALDKLQKAMIATNGKLELGDINEFANQIHSIGGDADTLLTTMSTSVQQGLFSNKSLDALKDFGKNIRSGSDSVKKLLDSVGKGDVLANVQKGLMSQQEAYKQIYSDFDKYTLKQQQELTTLLGGGGEALGARGIQTLAEMNGSLDDLVGKAGEYAAYNKEALMLQEELAKSQLKSTNQIAPLLKKFELFTLKLKIGFQEFLNPIVDWVMKISSEFGRLSGVTDIWFTMMKIQLKPIIWSFEWMASRISTAVQLLVSLGIGLQRLGNYLATVFVKIIDWVFGEGTFGRIKNFFNSIIDFVGAKWSQFLEVVNQSFEMIRKGIELDFDASGKAFEKSKQAAKELFSMSVTRMGGGESGGKGNTGDLNESNKLPLFNTNAVVKGAADTSANGVSRITSETKSVVFNIGNLVKIDEQNIDTEMDVKTFENYLTNALISAINNSQTQF